MIVLLSRKTTNQTNIEWKVYQGSKDLFTNETRWILHNDTRFFYGLFSMLMKKSKLSLLGVQTENFTATNDLFLQSNRTKYWRFEVIYHFYHEEYAISKSSIDFLVNQCPTSGRCSMYPFHGTTSTVFRLFCLDWIDEQGVKDYSFYGEIFLLLVIHLG